MTSNEAAASRLRARLREQDVSRHDEAESAEAQIVDLRGKLLEADTKVQRLRVEFETAKQETEALRRELDGHAQPDLNVRQLITDRLAALAGVLRSDAHEMRAMIGAHRALEVERQSLNQFLAGYPEYLEDSALVAKVDSDPSVISGLDDVLRNVVNTQAEVARARLAKVPDVALPPERARIYAGEGRLDDGSYAYVVVIPASGAALAEDALESVFVANSIAAVCLSLRERPGVSAPVAVPLQGDPSEAGLILAVKAECPDSDDLGLFDLVLEEQVRDWKHLGAQVEVFTDHALLAGLVAEALNVSLSDGY
jgi:hypothetical protein